jgi:hypothetical protein
MKPAGVWTMLFGIALLGLGGIFGLMGLSEFGTYTTLTASGNPFAGIRGNMAIAFLGIGAVGGLAGIALIIVGTQMKSEPRASVAVPPAGAGDATA